MQLGIWDEQKRLERLSELGDSLERLNEAINWEWFRPLLCEVFRKTAKGPGGRPPYDYILMFKILVLQSLYNLSDEQTEYQITDRLSFMRFLGLGLEDRIPDAKTIWLFRDNLTKADAIRGLFDRFDQQLKEAKLITRTGTIVDATFVDAPRQHNTPEEKEQLKEGITPEEWKTPKKIHKLRQKDVDARWTKKRSEFHFGYKNHVKADADSKLIVDYDVTPASTHDNQPMPAMINEEDEVLYGDSAYWGDRVAKELPKTVINKIHEKGTRGKPLTDEQKASNREKSRIRCRVEHIFGFMNKSMHGLAMRAIGIARAKFHVGMINLVYNFFRYEYLTRPTKSCA